MVSIDELNLCIMKNSYALFISILFLSIASCSNKQQRDNTETAAKPNRSIASISVLYYNYLIEPATPVKPEDIKLNIPHFDIDRKGVLDAQIVDSLKINDIKIRIDSLRPAAQLLPLDARLVAVIKYTDGCKQDTLCLGGYSVSEIFWNGVRQKTDNRLIFLLKNYAGFYPWMIGDDMFVLKELQDPSFAKAPFASSFYYETYQKALASR